MGLDTSHGCWHGSCSSFGRWREKISEVAGYGNLNDYSGFGGDKEWPAPSSDPLVLLLHHSDCDGELAFNDCAPIADALEVLLPSLVRAGDGGGHIGSYAEKTATFIAGLRQASLSKENVGFY